MPRLSPVTSAPILTVTVRSAMRTTSDRRQGVGGGGASLSRVDHRRPSGLAPLPCAYSACTLASCVRTWHRTLVASTLNSVIGSCETTFGHPHPHGHKSSSRHCARASIHPTSV